MKQLWSALITAVFAACAPASTRPSGAAEPSSAEAVPASSSDGATCEAACRHWADCRNGDYEGCLDVCDPSDVAGNQGILDKSCEELDDLAAHGNDSGRGGGDGSGCLARGANDCPEMAVCCGGDEATGTPGQCLSAAVCHGPTR